MRITKRSVLSGLAGVGVVLGAGGLAAAATATDVTPVSAAVVQQADPSADHANQVDDESSETPGEEADENEGDQDHESGENDGPEAADDAARAALATVTPDEASAAAIDSQVGTVQDVELSNKAGNVVYEVEIVDASGTEFEVIIDAGNGAVLASAAE